MSGFPVRFSSGMTATESVYLLLSAVTDSTGPLHGCHKTAANSNAMTAMEASRAQRRLRALASVTAVMGRGVFQLDRGSPLASASALANCLADLNRSVGDLDNARLITFSTPTGTVSLAALRDGTGSTIWRARMVRASLPWKGGSPASISYNTQPSA